MIVDSVNEIKGVSNVSRGHMHIQELEDGHVYIDSNISEAAHSKHAEAGSARDVRG